MALPSSNDRNTIHVTTASEAHPRPIVDVATATITYYGQAPLGTPTGDARWLVWRERKVGNVTTTEYANGSLSYNQAWDNRATLSYSR